MVVAAQIVGVGVIISQALKVLLLIKLRWGETVADCSDKRSSVYLQAWDDVERKARPTDKMSTYSKRTVLDQEKSKLSLSQLYEQQFLKQTQVCAVRLLACDHWCAEQWWTELPAAALIYCHAAAIPCLHME